MDTLIETFHIDLKLLIAQALNFGIVFLVLYYFILKPLIKVMRNRTKVIEKSLDDAKRIEAKLSEAQNEYDKTLMKAKKEVGVILENADQEAEKKKKDAIEKAKEEIGQIINQEKVKLEQEKAQTLKDIKKDVADLVITTVEKILEKKIDRKEDEELIKKMIKK